MQPSANHGGNHRRTRFFAIVGALLLAGGAVSLWLTAADAEPAPTIAPPAHASVSLPPIPDTPDEMPLLEAPAPLTREEKRFRRADRNDDGRIQQAEFLHQRRRNFDKLDVNGDGRLSFEEYAASGIKKFSEADTSGDGHLVPAEFALTAPKPRAASATAQKQCPPCALAQADD